MRFLIVEDDFGSRRLLETIVCQYGTCSVAVNGNEAVKAYLLSMEDKQPYDVMFLDIMMPELDGLGALEKIRAYEKEKGVPPGKELKVVMTTALEDPKTVVQAYYHGEAASYLVKPITPQKVSKELQALGLL